MLTLPPVKRKLFVERLEVAAAPAELERAARTGVVAEELAYTKALVEAGKLALGGDFADPLEGALYVLRTESLAEARELAQARPFTRAGLTRSSVHEWHVRFESPLGS
jgi:uncharacterized protein YciI